MAAPGEKVAVFFPLVSGAALRVCLPVFERDLSPWPPERMLAGLEVVDEPDA